MSQLSYVLITPAKNEEAYIGVAIESVTNQTRVPLRWVVIDDGSTDRTAEIVRGYAAKHPWIELVTRRQKSTRSFASKADAFNEACATVKDLDFDVIGNLDADVSFAPGYMERILQKFADDPRLGMAGTSFEDPAFKYDYRFTSIEHVAGPFQLFTRRCFDDIGGYQPMKGGGIDVVAVQTARMKGWKTRTFTDARYLHHRKMGTANNSVLMAKFRDGQKDYSLGAHPLWEMFRALYQTTQRPILLGACFLVSGYCWSSLKRVERTVSPEFVNFRRSEQLQRLKQFLTGFARSSASR